MTSELLITAELSFRTALHVGGSNGNEVVDDLVRRDASGRPFIPGSAVIGPLRALATRLAPRLNPSGQVCMALAGRSAFCGCPVCRLFGEVNPEAATEANELGGRASALWCADGLLDGTATIRDGVGIERSAQAAARKDNLKYNAEVFTPHRTLVLKLTLQSVGDAVIDEQNQQLLAVLLHEWQRGRGSIGGRTSRGLGAFTLSTPLWYERDLSKSAGLMAFLRRDDSDFLAGTVALPSQQTELLQTATGQPNIPAPTSDRLTNWDAYAVARAWAMVELDLHFDGPMLVSDSGSARWSGFDHAPIGARPGAATTWILPGAGLRGVLRSQAERIARTLATRMATSTEDFLERCPAGDPTNIKRADQPLATSDALLFARDGVRRERTLPSEHDLADRLFGGVRLGSRLSVEDAPLIGEANLKALDFLAIDRFTGGGRDSAKFDAVTLWQPTFRVRLRLENPQPWELGWLLLSLRDVHDGFTTVGFGRSKGFGRARIADWQAQLGFLDATDLADLMVMLPDDDSVVRDGVWTVLHASKADGAAWLATAQSWVRDFNTVLAAFRRSEDGVPPLRSDSYFGVVDALYPRIVETGHA